MIIKYINSACQEITTDSGFTLLLDPWLKDGAFHGSWCMAYEPAPLTKKPDMVWVSHIHPDHYCPQTLRDLHIETVYHTKGSYFLSARMAKDGFRPFEAPSEWMRVADDLEICALQYDDIDSVILARSGGKTILFYVDTPTDDAFIKKILDIAGKIDLAYLPYAGGGPWPQCFNLDVVTMRLEADAKKEKLLSNTVTLWEKLGRPLVIIYAGEYTLGGQFASMNSNRGNPTREEAHLFLRQELGSKLVEVMPGAEVFPATCEGVDVAYTYGDARPHEAFPPRPPYDTEDNSERVQYDMNDFPFLRIMRACEDRMLSDKSRFTPSDQAQIKKWHLRFVIDGTGFDVCTRDRNMPQGTCVLTIYCSFQLFMSAALGVTHWNNLEVGSHLRFSRTPEEYCRPLHRLLSFFHI